VVSVARTAAPFISKEGSLTVQGNTEIIEGTRTLLFVSLFFLMYFLKHFDV
jgi:hypothetical protein